MMTAASKLLALLALFVGAARGALASFGTEYTSSSSNTLEPLGKAHHLLWDGINFEVSGKSSRSGNEKESHSSSSSSRYSNRVYQHHSCGGQFLEYSYHRSND